MKIASLQLDSPVILAPMAGISDLPYRLVMKRFGVGLVFTEMVSANGLVYNGSATRDLLRSSPDERPLGIQLFGEDPQRLAEAADSLAGTGELLDLNLGCPVRKVTRAGAGSALLRDPAKVGRMVAALRKVTTGPLTVKIRSGWDRESVNFLEIARIAVEEGVDAITLHPRTRNQGFGGKADWTQIRELKQAVAVPVIGSGDIFEAEDAKTMFVETGCDAVMIGRGGYGNPWLVRQILEMLDGRPATTPTAGERLQLAREHLDLFLDCFGPSKTLGHMRKHLCWYVRGLEHAALFRARINQLGSIAEMYDLLDNYFTSAA